MKQEITQSKTNFIWIEMMEARNITSHTYNQNFAKELADEIINKFTPQFHKLKENLGEKL